MLAAVFQLEQGQFRRLEDDMAISVEELGERLKKTEKNKFLVGDGALLCYNSLWMKIDNLILLPEHLQMQRAAGVALLAWEQVQAGLRPSGRELEPNYLRLSQAERERMNKQKME